MGEVLDKWNEAKAWYQSKTIIGIILAAVGTLVKTFWPEVDIQGAAEVALEEGDNLATGIDSIWGSIMQGVGLAVAAWGRFKAKVGIK